MARSPSHIYKHLLRFLCNKMPCRPINFFLFILFHSKALEFFFFVIAVSRHGFCTDRWRCSKCRCVQFHFSAEITFTLNNTILQETMNTVIRRTSYKSRDVDRILLLKKIILPLIEIIFFYIRFHRMSARILFSIFFRLSFEIFF